jgi:hypothetical protein
MQAFDELRQLIEAIAEDVAKAEGGNKAAGTRVRKQMQEAKKLCQAVRQAILEQRTAKEEGAPPAPTV